MTDETQVGDALVRSIGLPEIELRTDDAEPPLRIIRRGALSLAKLSGAKWSDTVRPCEHSGFVLDEEWSTVTCSKCNARVEPFAALMYYAEMSARMEHRREMIEHAEWRMLAASVREMVKRREFSDAERESITHRTHIYGLKSLAEIRELHADVSARVQATRASRRQRRA